MNKILVLYVLFISCNNISSNSKSDSTITDHQRDSIIEVVDRGIIDKMLEDTIKAKNAPVKILKARIIQKEYSSYKSISLTYKNVSGKDIEAIRFSWYGVNAFDEPADMGSSLVEGFGGGFMDDGLRANHSSSDTWSILSRDAKKVIAAWPTEVVFEDGTKWEIEK